MSRTDDLLNQSKELIDHGKNAEVISLLPDTLLAELSEPLLYYNRALAYDQLGDYTNALSSIQRAIELNPKYSDSYIMRGKIRDSLNELQLAIEDYNHAILLNPNSALAHYNRGLVFTKQKEYARARQDFDRAISLIPDYFGPHIARGNVYFDQGEYDKALEDYLTAIRIKPSDPMGHFNTGLVYKIKNDTEKAIKSFNKAIELDENYANSYYNRALIYTERKLFQEAIDDYELFIQLTNNLDDYWVKVAQSAINELKTKLNNDWYDEVDDLVAGIKQQLLYTNDLVTHYTSISAAKAMIIDKSVFRLSEGSFLNDTSEGRELFTFLNISGSKKVAEETLAVDFTEKPFIGSFVSDNKHDDLTLWRMYGKEGQLEAQGCALTISKSQFIADLKNALTRKEGQQNATNTSDLQFTFYKVAYKNKDEFFIPGADHKELEHFNDVLRRLKKRVSTLSEEEKNKAIKLINDIAFLFKLSEYQHESEVRLVIPGAGFRKHFAPNTPPRVFIELSAVVPFLYKITLGPKVDRSEEWAAAFNYSIKEQNPHREQPVSIVISHLPFK